MEKIIVFFCDIYGTFDSGLNLNIDCNQLTKFIKNLETLIQMHGCDKLIFSFVTTEDIEIVLSMERKLRDKIGCANIDIGTHFCSDGNDFNVDKPLEILNYIKLLEKHYIVNQVYYADDCEFYHSILSELKVYFDIDCNVQSIIPKKRGLADVNDYLENISLVLNKKKIKSMR